MKQRCNNVNNQAYDRYGGRGIKVCDRWEKFENFLEDMGEPIKGMTLDRKDNDGNYELDNCHWVDMKAQSNNRSSNHLLTHNDETKTISQWAELVDIAQHTIRQRIKDGWTVERTLTARPSSNNRKVEIAA